MLRAVAPARDRPRRQQHVRCAAPTTHRAAWPQRPDLVSPRTSTCVRDEVGVAGSRAGRGHAGRQRAGRCGRSAGDRRACVDAAARAWDGRLAAGGGADRRAMCGCRRRSGSRSLGRAPARADLARYRYARVGRIARLGTPPAPRHVLRVSAQSWRAIKAEANCSQRATRTRTPPKSNLLHCRPLAVRSPYTGAPHHQRREKWSGSQSGPAAVRRFASAPGSGAR